VTGARYEKVEFGLSPCATTIFRLKILKKKLKD
jgi:hypothetical protein